MFEPDWLKKAREEGRVTETSVNADVLGLLAHHGPLPYTEIADELDARARAKGVGITEAGFQEQVVAYARLHCWRVAHFRKVRVQRAGGEVYWETPVAADGKGMLDLLMVRGDRIVFAELKVGRNTPTPEQQEWLSALSGVPSLGVYVWRPENWDEIVCVLGGGPPPPSSGSGKVAV